MNSFKSNENDDFIIYWIAFFYQLFKNSLELLLRKISHFWHDEEKVPKQTSF